MSQSKFEWKVGVFDTIIGYESVASPNNPNYSRSYGQTIEPQTHTGLLGSYRVNDTISLIENPLYRRLHTGMSYLAPALGPVLSEPVLRVLIQRFL